jgi:hypothetical protein
MPEIKVEDLVEIRKPYADRLAAQASPRSLVHEGMVGIVERIAIHTVGIAARRNDRTPRGSKALTRTETRVWVVWERSPEQGGGTWTAVYPLSALKIAK